VSSPRCLRPGTPRQTKHDPSESVPSLKDSRAPVASNVGGVLGHPGHGLATEGTEALHGNRAPEGGSDSPLLPVSTGLKGKGNLLSSIRHKIRSMAKCFQGHLLTRAANVDCSLWTRLCSLLRRFLWRRLCRKCCWA